MRRMPAFWRQSPPLWLGWLAKPATQLYQLGYKLRRRFTRTWTPPLPVICVGNAITGGVGKTPVVQSLLVLLNDHGLKVHCVSRGYGGHLRGPVRVDLSDHDAYDVGDEPLLLARHAPTWVAKNRRDGIVAAHAAGADVVICDDGLQNPTVAYACQLMVFDPLIGVGNGLLIPAGPLREPLDDLIARIDAVVCIGKAMTHPAEPHTFVVNTLNDLAELSPTQPVVAFAGIGYPEKFFHSLAIQGVHIMSKISFPDHHPFTEEDLATLRTIQDQYRALLVTTEKDYVRLPKAQRFDILPIPLRLEWQESPLQFILEKIHDPRWLA